MSRNLFLFHDLLFSTTGYKFGSAQDLFFRRSHGAEAGLFFSFCLFIHFLFFPQSTLLVYHFVISMPIWDVHLGCRPQSGMSICDPGFHLAYGRPLTMSIWIVPIYMDIYILGGFHKMIPTSQTGVSDESGIPGGYTG